MEQPADRLGALTPSKVEDLAARYRAGTTIGELVEQSGANAWVSRTALRSVPVP